MPRGVPNQPRTTAPSVPESVEAAENVEVEPTPTVYTPRTLPKDYDGTLYVRNETDTYVSFDDGKGNILKLRQAGTPDSISNLDPSIARHPGFRRFWTQGKVTVSDDPEMEVQIERFAFDEADRARADQISIQQKIYNPRTQELEWPGIGDITNNLDDE